MSRGLWFVAGAGAGVYAMVRARRLAEAVTPDGLRDRAHALALGARLFGAEVREGQATRQGELRRRGGSAHGELVDAAPGRHRALPATDGPPAAPDHPDEPARAATSGPEPAQENT